MDPSQTARLTLPVSERDHAYGPATAPVTLVEYGDFECPYCGQAYPIVKELQRRLGSGMRFVYRHFPLSNIHPNAQRAAESAEAAAIQGKFWEMHDALFENQRALDAGLERLAREVGLDVERWSSEMTHHTHAGKVRDDFMSGVRSGVNGTPTFYINGVRHDGAYDLGTLEAAIEAAASGEKRSSGA
jgi:protein-disulfide isomerase